MGGAQGLEPPGCTAWLHLPSARPWASAQPAGLGAASERRGHGRPLGTRDAPRALGSAPACGERCPCRLGRPCGSFPRISRGQKPRRKQGGGCGAPT